MAFDDADEAADDVVKRGIFTIIGTTLHDCLISISSSFFSLHSSLLIIIAQGVDKMCYEHTFGNSSFSSHSTKHCFILTTILKWSGAVHPYLKLSLDSCVVKTEQANIIRNNATWNTHNILHL